MLRRIMIAGAKRALGHLGWEVRPARGILDPNPYATFMSDEPEWVLDIVERVRPYTMTPPERVASLCHAIEYVTRRELPGEVVECGVWRGGSMMAAALALVHFKDTARSIYLFDTYEGMTPPTQTDKRVGLDLLASAMLAGVPRSHHLWGISPIEEVKTNLRSTGYPAEKTSSRGLSNTRSPIMHPTRFVSYVSIQIGTTPRVTNLSTSIRESARVAC